MKGSTLKSSRPFGVISQYGELPLNLVTFFDETAIFVNVDLDQECLTSRASFVGQNPGERPNPGHSLGNFFEWIVTNYEALPEKVAFVKSNIVPRHVSSTCELENLLCKQNGLVMLWDYPTFNSSHFQDSRVFPNFYLERNNSWFFPPSTTRKFQDFDCFMDFIFVDWIRPKWVPFAPGACYVVARELIEAVPKELFEFFLEISTYKFFPSESYAVERAMWLVFNQCGTFQGRFSTATWRSEVPSERFFPAPSSSLLFRAAEALEHAGCRLQQKITARQSIVDM